MNSAALGLATPRADGGAQTGTAAAASPAVGRMRSERSCGYVCGIACTVCHIITTAALEAASTAIADARTRVGTKRARLSNVDVAAGASVAVDSPLWMHTEDHKLCIKD
jgi:hypothetical protein